MPDIGKPEQQICVELTIRALDSDGEESTALISKTDAEIAFAEAISKLDVQGPLNERLEVNGVLFGGFKVVGPGDTVRLVTSANQVLTAIRDRLLDFDDDELEIGLLYKINEYLDDDPFSVRLTPEMWDDYKRMMEHG